MDDPSIISITSSAIIGTTSYHRDEPRIEPPPGLTHPSKLQQQVNKDAVAKASSGVSSNILIVNKKATYHRICLCLNVVCLTVFPDIEV